MHWGHAVSRDLVNWQELDTALYPGVEGTCFSGSAVVDHQNSSQLFESGGGLVALYTSHLEQPSFDRGYLQQQCLAYSADAWRRWTKYAQNPVISSPGVSDFRDPKVIWHESTQTWVQLLAVGQEIHFYRSINLIDWQYVSCFGAGQGAHSDGAWECPDLVELAIQGEAETRWVLVVGMVPPEDPLGSFTQYFIGHFDGSEFSNLNPSDLVLRMDWGRDFYAAQSWSTPPQNRALIIAWMSNWHYANEVPAQAYRGNMTLVRELGLRRTLEGIRLVQKFVLPYHREEYTARKARDIDLSRGKFIAGVGVGPRSGSLSIVIEPDCTLNLGFFGARSQLRLERDRLGCRLWGIRHSGEFYSTTPKLQASESEQSFLQKFDHEYSIELGDRETIELSWVTDFNILEVLVNEGSLAITQLVLEGSSGEPVQVELVQVGARLISFGEYLL